MRRIVMCLLCSRGRLPPSGAEAQVLYGSVVGTVQDESGAAVPNAAVAIVEQLHHAAPARP